MRRAHFCDISRYCRPEALTVHARYSRAGLDINPLRGSGGIAAPGNAREIRQ